jgi:putative hydrolase of the HAD superfamily
MQKYYHIFFDLDRTLWDFNKNSFETLKEVFIRFDLKDIINTNIEDFFRSFLIHNDELWEEYKSGKIFKSTIKHKRFYLALKDYGFESNKLTKLISEDYSSKSPQKKLLLPGAVEVLEYLKDKYSLNIITNGFKDSQEIKLKSGDLKKYFNNVIISEIVGAHKPDAKIFRKALQIANATKENSIMIGDDLTVDILGAKNSGIDQVYFNPSKYPHKEVVTYEISSLMELMEIL